ncbi:MAG: M48 family metalloprotease, partial [Flaviflexus sp.]|nr:M48 family metalloprotease [Flaviflexus sp.]
MNRSLMNTVKTTILLGCMWALLLGIGALLANGTGSSAWIIIFAGISLFSTAYSYWNSDKLALRAMQAREVSRADFPWYHDTVRELSEAAGKPMPRLYVSPTSSPNAFATGRNPNHAAVCVTEGILDILEKRELRAVLGHELMHVYNRDILTSSIAAGMAGIITSVAQFAFFFGGRRREGGGIAVVLMALAAPFAATLIQLAISRTREFDADHDGAELAQDPLALASALKKISGGAAAAPLRKDPATETVSHMMIANPFNLKSLFSTHPPMDERIRRLEQLAG